MQSMLRFQRAYLGWTCKSVDKNDLIIVISFYRNIAILWVRIARVTQV
jgi:hypothetical protein